MLFSRYEPRSLSLRPFKFFSNSFIDFYSCKVVSSSEMGKKDGSVKFRPLRIHGGCFETLNFTSCKFFRFFLTSMVTEILLINREGDHYREISDRGLDVLTER